MATCQTEFVDVARALRSSLLVGLALVAVACDAPSKTLSDASVDDGISDELVSDAANADVKSDDGISEVRAEDGAVSDVPLDVESPEVMVPDGAYPDAFNDAGVESDVPGGDVSLSDSALHDGAEPDVLPDASGDVPVEDPSDVVVDTRPDEVEDTTAPPTDTATPTPRPNEPPVARGETFYGVLNTVVSVTDVRQNDLDPEADPLSVVLESAPAFGTLAGPTPGGTFSYTPNPGFIGADRFTYRINDGQGSHDTAEVRIHIANRTFHVDPAGEDTADGLTPATAWKTLAKVAAQQGSLQPGDLVLLKRGATFRESLNFSRSGASGRPIVIGAYGVGPRPVISGGRLLRGFTPHGGGIFRASVVVPPGETLKYVFVDGVRMNVARFPDTGWLRTDGGSKNHLLDAALTAPAGTYNGARVVMHTVNWAFETASIASHSAGRLDFVAPTWYFTGPNDWGYFLENKLSLLNSPGEYFYDVAASTLYLIPPAGIEPNQAEVEIVSVNRPLQLRGNYQVADGLEVRHGLEGALFITFLNHHVTVRDCELHQAWGGIRGFADDVELHENLIHDTYDFGLSLDGARNIITRNRLTDISMVPGLGKDRWGYFGLSVGGSDGLIRHNLVERVGYIAFSVQGDRHVVEENHVRHGVSILNDGGNFAFDFLDGVVFRRNIAMEPIGDSPSASSTQTMNVSIAFNYYFGDKRIQNTTLEHNIGGTGVSGIHVDHTLRTLGNVIADNLMWNHTYGITFSDFSNYVENSTGTNCKPSYDDKLLRNTVFATSPDQYALHLLEVYCLDFLRWGTFDQNRYLNPFGDELVYRFDFISPRHEWRPGEFAALHEYFTLAEWQQEPVRLDAQSTGFTLAWSPPPGGDPTRLVVNPARGPRRVALDGRWMRLDGTTVSGSLEVPPYGGEVLLRL